LQIESFFLTLNGCLVIIMLETQLYILTHIKFSIIGASAEGAGLKSRNFKLEA